MNLKKIISNFTVAFFAQAISLVLSFLTSLIVPKLLGVEQFGYWQLFIFYASYAGLFHFGLNDGVYLIYGGKNRDSINKDDISLLFRIEICFQLVLSLFLVVLSLLLVKDEQRLFVIASTSIYICIFNLSNYIWCLFQAINETKLYSKSIIISKVSFLILLILLLVFRITLFQPFVISYIFSQVCALFYSLFKGREILFGGSKSISQCFSLVIRTIRVGIKLTISNLSAMLTIGVARFVVDSAWGIEEFGQFSLAISLVNFALLFVTQLAMVLYPALKQSKDNEIVKAFSIMRSSLSLLLSSIYVLFFPISWILELWLPSYSNAFYYFGLLLPICLFDSKMNLVGVTFLKVKRKEKDLLLINLCTVCITVILVFISVYIAENINAVIISMVFTMSLRGIFTEKYVEHLLDADSKIIVIGEVILSLSFILMIVCYFPFAFIIIMLMYAVFIYINRNELSLLYKVVLSLRKDFGK